jgi:hypothetical protein
VLLHVILHEISQTACNLRRSIIDEELQHHRTNYRYRGLIISTAYPGGVVYRIGIRGKCPCSNLATPTLISNRERCGEEVIPVNKLYIGFRNLSVVPCDHGTPVQPATRSLTSPALLATKPYRVD